MIDYRAIDSYETVNLFSLAEVVKGFPQVVQHLDGKPFFMGDQVYYPVEYARTEKRDSIRADLLQPINEMEALAWLVK
jgi:hypothetical protein